MDFNLWIAFAAASMALLIVPGPTIFLVVTYALSQGRRVALATAAGVALGDLVAMTASLLGLGALVLLSATLFTVLKWIGAAYLVWLGVKLLRAPVSDVFAEAEAAVPVATRSIFVHAFAVTALNPKSIIFFIAFVPQFIRPGEALPLQFTVLIATFVTLALVNAFAYALLADRIRAKIRKPGVMAWVNRAGGITLIGMGALTAALKRA